MNPETPRDGYVADLLRRMRSDEVPPPTDPRAYMGQSIGWLAHREAEKLDDLALLPQVDEEVRAAPADDRLRNLAFVLMGLISNTRSPAAIDLFLEVAELIPPGPISLHFLIDYAIRAEIREFRDFALRHLDTDNGLVLGKVIQFLGKTGDEGDIPTLGALLDSDTRGLKCGNSCAAALGEIGHPDALPYLRRAVERHRKARKNADKDTRYASEFAIRKLTGEPDPDPA